MPVQLSGMPFLCKPTMIRLLLITFFLLSHFSYGQWEIIDAGVKCDMRAIHAISPSICWIGGSEGTIIKTLNGGKTWTQYKVPSAEALDFRDIHVIDKDNVLAMSAGLSQEGKAKIFRTSDGGEHWNLVYVSSQHGVFLDGMAFWDSKTGICQGDPIDGHFFILRTIDGGITWQESPEENQPLALKNEACFAASGTSLVTNQKGVAYIGTGGAAFARIIKTVDYGNTWQYIVTPLKAGPTSGIFGINFWSKKEGIAVGGDYKKTTLKEQNVLLTSDGGKTWKLQAATEPAGLKEAVGRYPLNSKIEHSGFKIRSKKYAIIAVGPSGSSYSFNFGSTWSELGTDGFHAVSFIGNTGYAVGANGLIAKITNMTSEDKEIK